MKRGSALVVLAAASCAGTQAATQPQPRALTAGEQKKSQDMGAAGDAAWEQRAQRPKLEEAIRAWEAVVAVDVGDSKTWTKVTRGYYWLAEGYVAFDANSDDAYLATLKKGMDAGTQAIRNYSDKTRKKLDMGAKLEELAPDIDKDGVPAMYWYASCLGRWAKKQGTATAVLYKDTIRKVQERVKDLDENYFYAAPLRYFGAFYSFAPGFAGGDVEKGKQFFEDAIKRYPGCLSARVLYADTYAAKVQDEDLFKRQLQMVLDEKDDVIPEIAWENHVAKKQARALLARQNELF